MHLYSHSTFLVNMVFLIILVLINQLWLSSMGNFEYYAGVLKFVYSRIVSCLTATK